MAKRKIGHPVRDQGLLNCGLDTADRQSSRSIIVIYHINIKMSMKKISRKIVTLLNYCIVKLLNRGFQLENNRSFSLWRWSMKNPVIFFMRVGKYSSAHKNAHNALVGNISDIKATSGEVLRYYEKTNKK